MGAVSLEPLTFWVSTASCAAYAAVITATSICADVVSF